MPKAVAGQVDMRVQPKPPLAEHANAPRSPVMGRSMGEFKVRAPTGTLGRAQGGIQPERGEELGLLDEDRVSRGTGQHQFKGGIPAVGVDRVNRPSAGLAELYAVEVLHGGEWR